MDRNALRCRRKFLSFFPRGFRDETYVDWERSYKWETHQRWQEALGRRELERLLEEKAFAEVAARAVRVEQRSRHSMIFSFEKMALRDAVKSPAGRAHSPRGCTSGCMAAAVCSGVSSAGSTWWARFPGGRLEC